MIRTTTFLTLSALAVMLGCQTPETTVGGSSGTTKKVPGSFKVSHTLRMTGMT